MRWLIYACAVLIPVVYSVDFESSFTIPKLTVLRLLTLAMVSLWSIQVLAQGHLSVRRSPMNKWMIAYAGVLLITTVTSHYFLTSFWGDQTRFLGLPTMLNLLFVMAVVIVFFQDKKNILRYVQLSVFTAVALSLYGLLQFKGLLSVQEWSYDPTFRVFGTMGHSNHFGAYLGFHLMLLFGLLFRAPRRTTQVLYVAAAFPLMATILATASRGAFFATLGAGLIFGAGMLARKWNVIQQHKKRVLGAILAAALLIVVFWGPLVNRFTHLSLTQRTLSTIEFVKEGNIPDRVSWWFSAIAMVKDQPFLGHGLSTFHEMYNQYRRTDYRVPGDIQDTFTPETAHMEYLDIAATQGLVGLLVYLGLIGCWFGLLWKVMRNPDVAANVKILALGMLCAGLVYFIQVLLSFGVISTLVPLYLLMGVSVALYHITSDPKSQSEQFTRFQVRGGKAWASAAGMFVLVMMSFWFTVRQAEAEWALDKALHAKKEGEVAEMLEWHQRSVDAMPWMVGYWQAYGESAFEFSAYDNDLEIVDFLLNTSISAYNRSLYLVQTLPHLQANLGIAYITSADVSKAQGRVTESTEKVEIGVELYREAVTVAVNNPLFAYNFALILQSLDRSTEARDAFLHVLEIRAPYKDTYYQLALISTDLKDYDNARLYVQKALLETPSDDNVKVLLQRINSETSNESL